MLLPRSALLCFTALALIPLTSRAAEVEGVTEDHSAKHSLKPYDRKPDTAPAETPDAAQKGFRRAKIPVGFKADLWASEPLLANPVAFSFDGQGRMYVAETHRYRTSVLDIRHYMFMLEDDLANRNQADFERSIKKNFPDDWQKLGVESEVVRLVEDTNADGKADKTSVYADGFNSILDGIASGVLARPDGVWLANIPGLYKLTGKGPDGKAEKKEEVLRGFGVRFNYTGHDLHGLIKGPDGRLYFSIGDRGASVKTKEGTLLEVPDEGAIFRCEEDGSHLELFMRGLRNPQELAFDDYGNLFTCDNDSDQGDRERLVYVVEGGDAGWRVGYQHCPQPAERNPWLAEHMWEPRDSAKNQPAYILSPVANMPDGPGGLVHYPGTGLPDKYNGCFFLACYKGSSLTSQVAVFRPVPDGAGFKLEMLESFIPGCQATDVDFGPDSRLYVSFWDEGWERTAQGRIMRVEHEEARKAQAAQITEVQKLLAEGMKERKSEELVKLLGHKDQRVRLEAQWELAGRALDQVSEKRSGIMKLLQNAVVTSTDRMTRLHSVWAIGHAMRIDRWHRRMTDWKYVENTPKDPKLVALFTDKDEVIRAAWADIHGRLRVSLEKSLQRLLLDRLNDESQRVRMAAVRAVGLSDNWILLKLSGAVPALLETARREQDNSQEMRHAIAEALHWCAVGNRGAWEALRVAAKAKELSVRMVTLLALGKLTEMAQFTAGGVSWWENADDDVTAMLRDSEPAIVREAARLLSGLPVDESNPNRALAGLGAKNGDRMTTLRMLNANHRYGSDKNAEVLANFAADESNDGALRAEALRLLGLRGVAVARDQVVGIFRIRSGLTLEQEAATKKGVGPRTAHAAYAALDRCLKGEARIATAALETIRRLEGRSMEEPLARLITEAHQDAGVRALALHVLADLQSPLLTVALQKAITDSSSMVRIAAAGLMGKTDPALAAKGLAAALADGSPEDQRAAFTELAALHSPEADKLLAEHLALLTAGKVPAMARLELVEATKKREAPAVKEALAAYEASLPNDDFLAKYAVSLEGGDVVNGKRLFKEHPVAACQRCHMVDKAGGEAGPPLDGIASRKDRRYLLESIVNPNAVIADTFRMLVCTMKDGSIQAGVIQSETADTLTLQQPGDQPVAVPVADIAKREPVPSGMLPGMGELLTPRELRDLVEYCASLK